MPGMVQQPAYLIPGLPSGMGNYKFVTTDSAGNLDAGTLTAGYVPFGSATGAFGQSANFFWDSANNRLGIGTATPALTLQVAGVTGIGQVNTAVVPAASVPGMFVAQWNTAGGYGECSLWNTYNGVGAFFFNQVTGAGTYRTIYSGGATFHNYLLNNTVAIGITTSGLGVFCTASYPLDVFAAANTYNQRWQINGSSFYLFLKNGNSTAGGSTCFRMVLNFLGSTDNNYIDFRRGGDGTSGYTVLGGGNTNDALLIDSVKNVVTGGAAAVATNATNGFLYIAGCAGAPTGTPTTYTGCVPLVVDTTNNKLYFYSGGAWRDAGP